MFGAIFLELISLIWACRYVITRQHEHILGEAIMFLASQACLQISITYMRTRFHNLGAFFPILHLEKRNIALHRWRYTKILKTRHSTRQYWNSITIGKTHANSTHFPYRRWALRKKRDINHKLIATSDLSLFLRNRSKHKLFPLIYKYRALSIYKSYWAIGTTPSFYHCLFSFVFVLLWTGGQCMVLHFIIMEPPPRLLGRSAISTVLYISVIIFWALLQAYTKGLQIHIPNTFRIYYTIELIINKGMSIFHKLMIGHFPVWWF